MIGHLCDKSAIILKPTTATDASGGVVQTFASAATAMCRIQFLSTGESLMAGAQRGTRTARIYFDGTPDIDAQDRITISGTTYDVIEPLLDFDGQGAYSRLTAEERAGDT